MQQKEKTNINLSLSKELLNKIKEEANKREMPYSTLIRLIIQTYFNKKENE